MTRTLSIETRQHDLAGIDLGEGPPRAALVFGAIVVIAWCGSLLFLFGLPSKFLVPLYIAPPAVLAIYGFQEDEANPRRRKITSWTLSVRSVLTGQRPIVALGRHQRPADQPRLLRRIAIRFAGGDVLALLVPARLQRDDLPQRGPQDFTRADPIKWSPQIQHFGTVDVLRFDAAQQHKRDEAAKRASARRQRVTNLRPAKVGHRNDTQEG